MKIKRLETKVRNALKADIRKLGDKAEVAALAKKYNIPTTYIRYYMRVMSPEALREATRAKAARIAADAKQKKKGRPEDKPKGKVGRPKGKVGRPKGKVGRPKSKALALTPPNSNGQKIILLEQNADLVRTVEQVLDRRLGLLFQAMGQLLLKDE